MIISKIYMKSLSTVLSCPLLYLITRPLSPLLPNNQNRSGISVSRLIVATETTVDPYINARSGRIPAIRLTSFIKTSPRTTAAIQRRELHWMSIYVRTQFPRQPSLSSSPPKKSSFRPIYARIYVDEDARSVNGPWQRRRKYGFFSWKRWRICWLVHGFAL